MMHALESAAQLLFATMTQQERDQWRSTFLGANGEQATSEQRTENESYCITLHPDSDAEWRNALIGDGK